MRKGKRRHAHKNHFFPHRNKGKREKHAMLSAEFHGLCHETSSDHPGPRCGHTLTALQWDGVHRLVAFGGATALENASNSSSNATTTTTDKNANATTNTNNSSSSSSGVRLAGATNDVHVFDVKSGTWQKLRPSGDPPSPRAAHASANVGGMLVVHGGIGPSGLSGPDLHVLDLANYHAANNNKRTRTRTRQIIPRRNLRKS